MLVQHALQRGLSGLTADVLATNKSMFKVFEKGEYPMQAKLRDWVYSLTINFTKTNPDNGRPFKTSLKPGRRERN